MTPSSKPHIFSSLTLLISAAETPRKFVIASRASPLARAQTDFVRDEIAKLQGPRFSCETSFMTTRGDSNIFGAPCVL